MDTISPNDLIAAKTGEFLRSARMQAGLSRETATRKLRYSKKERLEQYERGFSVPFHELARIIEEYGVPKQLVEQFFVDIQHDIWLLKKDSPI